MTISIIIPIYNNAESLEELFQRIIKVSNNELFVNCNFEIICVNDGSDDESYKILKEIAKSQTGLDIVIVQLTRNFGSYNAFLAGMNYANGKCNIHLHADLQDPPEEILNLFPHFKKGYKLVIANRNKREDSSVFSSLYHYLIKKFGVSNIPKGGFDLILFDEKIRKEILNISEKNTNNVYLISWLGYDYVNVPYTRVKRRHGNSQWTFRKKIKLFVDTLFSFTDLPLIAIRLIFYLSALLFAYSLFSVFYYDRKLIDSNLFLFSALFFLLNISMVIIAEYLNRIHETVRRRPNFVIEKVENHNN